MTTEQQNKAWESLPKEAKEFARNLYRTSHIPQYEVVLDSLFGESNLSASESEPKTKFKVGDKVRIVSARNIVLQDKVGTVAEKPSSISNDLVKVKFSDKSFTYLEPCQLVPYTEPTATEDKEKEQKQKLPLFPLGTKVYTIYGDGVVNRTIDGDIAVMLDDGSFCGMGSITAVKEDGEDWQSYRMELAAKIAVAYAEKGRYEPEDIGARAVKVANEVVRRLKNSEQ